MAGRPVLPIGSYADGEPILRAISAFADIKTTMAYYVGTDDAYDERIRAAITLETDKQVTNEAPEVATAAA